MKSNKHRLLRVPDLKFPLSWRARPIWWAETLWCRSVDWNKSNTPGPPSVRAQFNFLTVTYLFSPHIGFGESGPAKDERHFSGRSDRFVVWPVHSWPWSMTGMVIRTQVTSNVNQYRQLYRACIPKENRQILTIMVVCLSFQTFGRQKIPISIPEA